jgi:uncharacterized protein
MNKEVNILKTSHTIAVVGLSSDFNKPSNSVAKYLKNEGYKIIPVNPNETEILGERCFPDLISIPVSVDIVDIFRRSEFVEPIVAAAIAIHAKTVWMQEGVINRKAAEQAVNAGLNVIMDKCIKKESMRIHEDQGRIADE